MNTQPDTPDTEVEPTTSLAGRYFSFLLGSECYGVPIMKVLEIIQQQDITPLPRTPRYLKGVLNLRGRIVPVIQLRTKLDMPTVDDTDLTCIVVVQVDGTTENATTMGILVDQVSEVINVHAHQVDPPPSSTGSEGQLFLGMAKYKQQIVMLLDIDKVISPEEIVSDIEGYE